MSSEFRILIIEDNPVDEQLFKATLSPLSLNIDVARDGNAGYLKLQSTDYDLMILDLIMPNFNGMELLKRADQERRDLPLTIVCSALSTERHIMDCLKLGASSYLIKPISALNLLTCLSDCLSLSRAKRRELAPPPPNDEKPLTLTRAMAQATCERKTGRILVDTAEGVGVLEYASGKLVAARFNELNGLLALERLRALPHRSVIVQLMDSSSPLRD